MLHQSPKPVHLASSKSYEGLIKANQGREYIGARRSNTLIYAEVVINYGLLMQKLFIIIWKTKVASVAN